VLSNGQLLQQMHEACMARAAWFIERGWPNPSEAAAVEQLLQTASAEMQQCGFKHLIGYEWAAHTEKGRRVGDMLFTNGTGRLLVVEAKGSSGSREAAQQQARALADALRSRYPGHQVYAAVWCPMKGTAWEWVGRAPDIMKQKNANKSSSGSSSSSSTSVNNSSCNSDTLPSPQPDLPGGKTQTGIPLLQLWHAGYVARSLEFIEQGVATKRDSRQLQ
jgi:DNA-binding protein H-NS